MLGARRAPVAALVAVALAAGCTEAPAAPVAGPSAAASVSLTAGAPGAGDPYFPTYGNGGYDVASYALQVRYDPATDRLDGTATITATATADLSRLNLDLVKLAATEVSVDGQPATAAAEGDELVVTPAAGLPRGRPFTVRIRYGGVPSMLTTELGEGGFLHTSDGAIALGEPESASTWFPVNDHPSDKASWSIEAAVPDGLVALSNGVPGERSTAGGWTTWRWSERTPMASYLATLVIGKYRVKTADHRGKPLVTAVAESVPAGGPAETSMAATPRVADWLAGVFGPYPVDAYGGIVVDDPGIQYALETQSRPVYSHAYFSGGPDLSVVAHEMAHQWFGDSVSVRRWKDIWLNEGFATYAEWMWDEHDGGASVQDSFDAEYADFGWTVKPGDPGVKELFGAAVYRRGAMTLHALRLTVGDDTFFRILKTWAAERRDRTAETADFVAHAERLAGKELSPLFDAWLFGTVRPVNPRR
jgi:aminopeptidase N